MAREVYSREDRLRQARADVARSEAHFRSLIEHATDAVMVLDANLAVSTRTRDLAERAGAVVGEVAGEDDLALLELGAVHRLASGSILGAENDGHCLEVLGIHGLQERIDGELRGGPARNLSGRAHLLGGARAGSKKD